MVSVGFWEMFFEFDDDDDYRVLKEFEGRQASFFLFLSFVFFFLPGEFLYNLFKNRVLKGVRREVNWSREKATLELV